MEQLLGMLMGQQNQSNLNDIMGKFGLDENQAKQAIGSLLPGVTQGIQRQAQAQNTSILSQIASSQQQQYLDDDNARLYDQPAIDSGNNILGQILGGKQASRDLAGQAAQQTGLDTGILKQLLPMVASMTMGSLGKNASAQGLQQNQSGLMSMVGSMLDTNGNGFGVDDIMGLASKFLR
ncbi:MAG: DUF937 domain-containing protein [Ostreibacterium sp.]